MVRIIFFIFIFFYSLSSYGDGLSNEEKIFLGFVDLNKDNQISIEEANKLINLIFQLVDKNQDGNVSEFEIIELKNIIKSLL